ncbi:pseudouridylate synthase 7 homolog-like protein [Lytechinus variegatus]|uniref:pseudouridylate synthase 7 homolog-like protein n=1 Tax=Lytechinus variegatus TaxID=7654 RepID=UPI001BB2795F|nr:pseudouridylate synthase 7 homolog-like protein [Lytechinus variegatus]
MFGIECYVSQHEGFKGTVKSNPEDFQVTEISIDGKLASLTDTRIDLSAELGIGSIDSAGDSHASPLELDSVCAQISSTSDTSKSPSIGIPTQVGESSPIQVNTPKATQDSLPTDCRKCLENILSADTFTELDKFAASELTLLKSSHSESRMEMNPSTLETHQAHLNLGVIASKESRTVIHKCVRYLYPHLRTQIHRMPSGGLEIHISREPAVVEFQHLQIPLSAVLEFLKFVELRDREDTFHFEGLESKDQRTKLHRLVAKHFGTFLETKTFGDGTNNREHQKVAVRFRPIKERKKRKGGESHPQDSVFTGFTLQKINTETLSAIQQLARLIGVQTSAFTYAGIKDKKAVTTQEMAVKDITSKRLEDISNQLPQWLKVGSIHPRTKPMVTAELWGNHFDITLQNVERKAESSKIEDGSEGCGRVELKTSIEHCIKCVEEKGFINYFGEQRFGASSHDPSQALTTISPADVGHAILQGNYKEAVSLILSPDDGPCANPSDHTNVAKRCFRHVGSPREALKLMPAMKTRECLLLKALNRHGTDDEGCIKALMNIPHNMRQMYVHAFCSLLWNQMASWRMRYHGYQVVEGDLVSTTDSKVHTVTEDDIAQDKYTIMEVMLPLPGNNIQYPSHTAGGEYQRRLGEAGLGECTFRIPALKLNIPGGYRNVIARPRNLKWGLDSTGDQCIDKRDDGGDYSRDMEDTTLPSNHEVSPAGNVSDASSADSILPAGSGNLMEASGRHVKLGSNESDSNPAVDGRNKEHRVSANQPLDVSACLSACHMVSNTHGNSTATTDGRTLPFDTSKTTDNPNSGVTTHQQYDGQLPCQTRDGLSHGNRQEDEFQSSSQSLKRTLNLSFNLPASCYATVFLRELMKS